jgi:DNA-binding CsgD family transcriptional regulator
MPEQQLRVIAEPVAEDQDVLVFAAASIVREMSGFPTTAPVREVVSDNRRYRLEGHRLVNAPGTAGPIVLVFVDAAAPEIPDDGELRERFGLTRKETAVARLIAQNQTNDQIAKELFISPHTARHHTERILAKLGANSRKEVRSALVGG